MNIAEILKNVPKGTKLYSTVFGDVELLCIDNSEFPIKVKTTPGGIYQYFTKEGKINTEYHNTECLLFPSKENRDWNIFKVEKSYEFKPFDKVLVRSGKDEQWKCNLYSHKDSNSEYPYKCIYAGYKQCIPYTGNEHLVGTFDNI